MSGAPEIGIARVHDAPDGGGRRLVTLLFAAKDREHDQAVALREHLAERLKRL